MTTEQPHKGFPVLSGMRSPELSDSLSDYGVVRKKITTARDVSAPYSQTRSLTLRDIVATIFRHRILVISSFLAILTGVALGAWLRPERYEANMKILVNRERVDPVSAPASDVNVVGLRDVTVEDLNSEVELLKSHDLLERVVVACGLHAPAKPSFFERANKPASEDKRISKAVLQLEKSLDVETIAKSKLIRVSYATEAPELGAQVLQSLGGFYLEKHLAVHRPPGVLDFFQEQTKEYGRKLASAEEKLAGFNASEGIVSIETEKDLALRRLSEEEARRRETETELASVRRRIGSLEAQIRARPERVVTQVLTARDFASMGQLRSTLLSLEMKRTELLNKYEPGYRAVKELDGQIAQTREAIKQAEDERLREESTDLDKIRLWLDEELAQARAQMASLQARSTEIEKNLALYRAGAREIGRREMVSKEIVRAAKTAEENYLLYLRKQEEARISDELDRKRIVNVAIAETATIPVSPSGPSRLLILLLGVVLAGPASLGLAIAVDHFDPCFRTPSEVESVTGLPVIASLPRA